MSDRHPNRPSPVSPISDRDRASNSSGDEPAPAVAVEMTQVGNQKPPSESDAPTSPTHLITPQKDSTHLLHKRTPMSERFSPSLQQHPGRPLFPHDKEHTFQKETPWYRKGAKHIAGLTLRNSVYLFGPVKWVPNYNLQKLRLDIVGGIVITIMVVPQSLAYAQLASLEPVYGLYACIATCIVYAIFGDVPVLAIGPVALLSILTAQVTEKIPKTTPGYVTLRADAAFELALQMGIISCIFGIIQAGVITRFVSHAVTSSFSSGAAILILLSQIKHFFGLDINKSDTIQKYIEKIIVAFRDHADMNTLYTFLFAMFFTLYLVLIRKIDKIPKTFPHQLVAVIVSTLICWGARLDEKINLSIVKTVPSGAPPVGIPEMSNFGDNLALAVVMCIVGFVESYAVARKFAVEQNFQINASKELFSLGMVSIVGSFFGAYPVTGSISRTAVAGLLKCASPVFSLVTAVGVLIVIFGLTELNVFYYLPKATLSAIVASACVRMIDYDIAMKMYKSDKGDFAVWVIGFLAVLLLGVEFGIIVGIGVGVILIVIRVSTPKMPELGLQVSADGHRHVRDASKHSNLETFPQIAMWGFDAPLFAVNAESLLHRCKEIMKSDHYEDLKVIILDCSGITGADTDGIETLHLVQKQCEKNELHFFLGAVKPKLYKRLVRMGVWGEGCPFHDGNCFSSMLIAIEAAHLKLHSEAIVAMQGSFAESMRLQC